MRIGEEPGLVAVVLLERRVAVEVVGREVREQTDRRIDVRRVVQLEARELEREPVRARRRTRTISQSGRPMLPAASALTPAGAEQVRDERSRRRLPVGAGDGDGAGAAELGESDVHLGVDRHAGVARRRGAAARPGGTPGDTTTAAAAAMRPRSCRPSSTSAPAARELRAPRRPAAPAPPSPRRTPARPRSRSSSVAATPLRASPTTATGRPLARHSAIISAP